MKKNQTKNRAGLAVALMAVGAVMLVCLPGCESRVVKAEGIGADASYPDRSEPTENPTLREFFFGDGSKK